MTTEKKKNVIIESAFCTKNIQCHHDVENEDDCGEEKWKKNKCDSVKIGSDARLDTNLHHERERERERAIAVGSTFVCVVSAA